jgi:hypothetical protein
MNKDIIKKKIRFETERLKLFFSSMIILAGGNISILSRSTLGMWDVFILSLGMIALAVVTFLTVKANNDIDSLFRKF